jgi:radical SAM protein (TIGR01212 family)
MNAAPRFRSFREWSTEVFGEPLHRVALDAGSACPNRDGTKGYGGCAYCDVDGSGTGALRRGAELSEQLELGLKRIARRKHAGRAVAYFQSYSNTYVDRERLEEVLSVVRPFAGREIAAVSLATRPDTLPESALDVLERWNRELPVWVELGLETANDAVLTQINRLHTLDEFFDAAARVKRRGLACIGHAILGLPGDGRDGARRTAEALARARVDGVKAHQLMVLEKTVFAHDWRLGKVETQELDAYVEWLADFVERLRPEQVLHRLHGDAPSGLLAPQWSRINPGVREALERELERRGTRQGSRCESPS